MMKRDVGFGVTGPLAAYVDGFRGELAAQGYTVQVRDRNLRMLAM